MGRCIELVVFDRGTLGMLDQLLEEHPFVVASLVAILVTTFVDLVIPSLVTLVVPLVVDHMDFPSVFNLETFLVDPSLEADLVVPSLVALVTPSLAILAIPLVVLLHIPLLVLLLVLTLDCMLMAEHVDQLKVVRITAGCSVAPSCLTLYFRNYNNNKNAWHI